MSESVPGRGGRGGGRGRGRGAAIPGRNPSPAAANRTYNSVPGARGRGGPKRAFLSNGTSSGRHGRSPLGGLVTSGSEDEGGLKKSKRPAGITGLNASATQFNPRSIAATNGKVNGFATATATPHIKPSARPKEKFGASAAQRLAEEKERRVREREQAIKDGVLADPDRPRELKDATTPKGTCRDMCPEYERLFRMQTNDVLGPEMSLDTVDLPRGQRIPDEARMVKRFQRSAAGIDEQLPSDLRPAPILKETCDYLFDHLLVEGRTLGHYHQFIWDRTRAIRNDFSIQQVSAVADVRLAIECFERIVRFHIVSLHDLGTLNPKPYNDYDYQQDWEQCDKALLSLTILYDRCRDRYRSPKEPEFWAYWILFHIQARLPDTQERIQRLPSHILQDGRVKTALQIFNLAQNNMSKQGEILFGPEDMPLHLVAAQMNWVKFFMLVGSKRTSFLMGCCAEVYFHHIRHTALQVIVQAIRKQSKDWTVSDLVQQFFFDSIPEAISFAAAYGMIRDEGSANEKTALDFSVFASKDDVTVPTGYVTRSFSDRLVEVKRGYRNYSAIIDGMSITEAQASGRIDEADEEEEEMDDAQVSDEEQLFVKQNPPSTLKPAPAPVNNTAPVFGQTLAQPATQPVASNPFAKFTSTPAFGAPDAGLTQKTPAAPESNPFNPFAKAAAAAPQKASFGFGNTQSDNSTPAAPLNAAQPFASVLTQPQASTDPAGSQPFSFARPASAQPQTAATTTPSIFPAAQSTTLNAANTTANPFALAGTTSKFPSFQPTTGFSAASTSEKPSNFAPVTTTDSSAEQSQAAATSKSVFSFLDTNATTSAAGGNTASLSISEVKVTLQPTPAPSIFAPISTSTATDTSAPSASAAPAFSFFPKADQAITATPAPSNTTQRSVLPAQQSALPSFQAFTPLPVPASTTPATGDSIFANVSTSKKVTFDFGQSTNPPKPVSGVAQLPSLQQSNLFAAGPPKSALKAPALPAETSANNDQARAHRKAEALEYISRQVVTDLQEGAIGRSIRDYIHNSIKKAEKSQEIAKDKASAVAIEQRILARKYCNKWYQLSRRAKLRSAAKRRREVVKQAKEKSQSRSASVIDDFRASRSGNDQMALVPKSRPNGIDRSSIASYSMSPPAVPAGRKSVRQNFKARQASPAVSELTASRGLNRPMPNLSTSVNRSSPLSQSNSLIDMIRGAPRMDGKVSTTKSLYFEMKARGLLNNSVGSNSLRSSTSSTGMRRSLQQESSNNFDQSMSLDSLYNNSNRNSGQSAISKGKRKQDDAADAIDFDDSPDRKKRSTFPVPSREATNGSSSFRRASMDGSVTSLVEQSNREHDEQLDRFKRVARELREGQEELIAMRQQLEGEEPSHSFRRSFGHNTERPPSSRVSSSRDLPAYHFRNSKFVPRNQYGKWSPRNSLAARTEPSILPSASSLPAMHSYKTLASTALDLPDAQHVVDNLPVSSPALYPHLPDQHDHLSYETPGPSAISNSFAASHVIQQSQAFTASQETIADDSLGFGFTGASQAQPELEPAQLFDPSLMNRGDTDIPPVLQQSESTSFNGFSDSQPPISQYPDFDAFGDRIMHSAPSPHRTYINAEAEVDEDEDDEADAEDYDDEPAEDNPTEFQDEQEFAFEEEDQDIEDGESEEGSEEGDFDDDEEGEFDDEEDESEDEGRTGGYVRPAASNVNGNGNGNGWNGNGGGGSAAEAIELDSD